MPNTIKKSRLQTNEQKIKLELNINKSNLTPNVQTLQQKLLSGNTFLVYK